MAGSGYTGTGRGAAPAQLLTGENVRHNVTTLPLPLSQADPRAAIPIEADREGNQTIYPSKYIRAEDLPFTLYILTGFAASGWTSQPGC